jgi:hypothetical protein
MCVAQPSSLAVTVTRISLSAGAGEWLNTLVMTTADQRGKELPDTTQLQVLLHELGHAFGV